MSETQSEEVDVVVIGVGTCGEDLSLRLLNVGLDVVGIEANLVGGECPYWACLPSKLMIRAANLLQEGRRADGKAGTSQITPDWELLAARVRNEVTGGWSDAAGVKRFEDRNGRLIHGRGKLIGPKTAIVGDERFTARRGVVIATGSQPQIPAIPGLDSVDYWTTHDVIAAETLPTSVIVLGGGTVGCELGQVMARFGADVTIVEAQERILPAEEPEASEVVAGAFAEEGIAVKTGAAAQQVAARDGEIVVVLAGGEEISGEKLLVATGRKIDVSSLGLESVGLDGAAGHIAVDERMNAADGLYAMGDVTGVAMFTHVALYQSAIVAADILGEEHPPASYHAVPRVTFTDPEVGAVGMMEAQARAAGIEVAVVVKQLPVTFRGWLHGSGNGMIKFVVNRQSGVLVGASVAGARGGEMLGLLALAVHARIPMAELQSMIYPFPSFYGTIGEAIGAYGRGLASVMEPTYEGFDILDAIGAP